MVHLMGSDDAGAAARYYASSLTGGEAAGATRALAAQIVAGEDDTGSRGHSRVTALLTQPMDDHARYSLCNRFVFDLADAVESEGPLDLRFEVLIETREQLERLAAQDTGQRRVAVELGCELVGEPPQGRRCARRARRPGAGAGGV